MANPTVWLLTYNHKHGEDVTVHRSKGSAVIALYAVALDNLYEIDEEHHEDVRAMCQDPERAFELCATWAELTQSREAFGLEEVEVQDLCKEQK
jgi:hypothetical protein